MRRHEETPSWPHSAEDLLLDAYLEDNSGTLFLEVEVGSRASSRRPRRLDGILVPGEKKTVLSQREYSDEDLREAVEGRRIHLLEAKVRLNRPVVGQVLVGERLFRRDFEPSEIEPVIVSAEGDDDLQWMCAEEGIKVEIYPHAVPRLAPEAASSQDPRDEQRRPPGAARRRAFLSGWTDAVTGKLYASIREKKTHQNMGNLFGWIYGDEDAEFCHETWERYVSSLGALDGEAG